MAQSGSAPVWGTGGRGFESRRPDQIPIEMSVLGDVRTVTSGAVPSLLGRRLPAVELAMEAVGDALEQVVGLPNGRDVQHRRRLLTHQRPLVRVLGKWVASLAGVPGRTAVHRTGLRVLPIPEVQVVQDVPRLGQVGADLHHLAEERDVLVLEAGHGRSRLQVDRLLVLLLLPLEQEHALSFVPDDCRDASSRSVVRWTGQAGDRPPP